VEEVGLVGVADDVGGRRALGGEARSVPSFSVIG
jgi:hypothetical protein